VGTAWQVPAIGLAKIREKMGVLISQKDIITKQGIDPKSHHRIVYGICL
jgi:hypothetical protein